MASFRCCMKIKMLWEEWWAELAYTSYCLVTSYMSVACATLDFSCALTVVVLRSKSQRPDSNALICPPLFLPRIGELSKFVVSIDFCQKYFGKCVFWVVLIDTKCSVIFVSKPPLKNYKWYLCLCLLPCTLSTVPQLHVKYIYIYIRWHKDCWIFPRGWH